MAEREGNFLRLVEKGIFGYPRSPYLPLLKLAQVEMGDIRHMVQHKGLEDTLIALREAGVYVTFEEFKGREPVVREGRVIPVRTHDFDNPYLRHAYEARTGGTTGAGTRVDIDLDHLAAQAPFIMLARDAHGALDIPSATWMGVLPDGSGPNNILRPARFDRVPEKWFTPITGRDLRPAVKYQLATYMMVVEGRLFGSPIPWPQPVPMDQAVVIARWVAETLADQGACLVLTVVSRALRVANAAWEAGLDLTGATFMAGGEPPTRAKVQGITRTGARWVPVYPFSETGTVGLGCARPADCNDTHFFRDALVLIQYPREVPESGAAVDAFCFTTLLPTAPKLLLNVESDDFGVVEERPCGCPLEDYGYTQHLRHIRSFGKLTGESVTLVGSEAARILEEVLPARFGGSPLDYQLLEEEDDGGFTRMSLLVSPQVPISDEAAVVQVFLQALGRGSVAADLSRAIWSQAGALRVRRQEPLLTARGKLMTLYAARRTRSSDSPHGSAS
jgi:hypothetical protein